MTTTPALEAAIDEGPEELTITLRSRKNLIHQILLGLWLAIWGYGLIAVVGAIFGKEGLPSGFAPLLFLVIWLSGWLAIGIASLYGFFWMLCGTEFLVVRNDAVVIRRTLLGHDRIKVYKAGSIGELFLMPQEKGIMSLLASPRLFGFGCGVVAFRYGVRVASFGEGLSLSEAQFLIARLARTSPFSNKSES